MLDPNVTRAWLKPVTHTSSLHASVGRPWEIFRYNENTAQHRVVDIYTKSGDVGGYHSVIALAPEFNVGFSVMTAGNGAASRAPLSAVVLDTLMPALESAARRQALANYGGTYASSGLNSSISLTAPPSSPGLIVTEWVSNSTDFLSAITAYTGSPQTNLHLYPTGLTTEYSNGTSKASFRLLFESHQVPRRTGVYAACDTWFSVDSQTYGNLVADNMVFGLDERGVATSVSPEVLKIKLDRQAAEL